LIKPPQIVCVIRRLTAAPSKVSSDDVLGVCERASLQAAHYIKEETGGQLTVLAFGPASREERVLAMALRAGCDRAVRVWDPQLKSIDYFGAANVLAKTIGKLEGELVLCGDRSQDNGIGAIGPTIAELLNLPHLSSVVDLDINSSEITASHQSAQSLFKVCLPLSAVLCIRAFGKSVTGEKSVTREGKIETVSLSDLDIALNSLRERRFFLGRSRKTQKSSPIELKNTNELASKLLKRRPKAKGSKSKASQ